MKDLRLDTYLKSAQELARLTDHAERLSKLQQAYAHLAPAHLAKASQVTNYKLGKLIVSAASGAVASKLKQLSPSLVREFSKRGLNVTELDVRVQVAVHHDSPVAVLHPPRRLGETTRGELQALAARLPAESPVRQSIERLLAGSE